MPLPTRATAVSAAAVPAAFFAANALSYGLLLAAAHRMSSAAYGTLSSLLGLLLISTIPMLALQTVTARRAAGNAGTAGVARGTALIAAGAGVLLLAASPGLSRFLHLDNVTGVVLVALTVPATSVIGSASGLAQGRRQFGRLALLILAGTGARSLGGVVGLLIRPTADAALLGAVVGAGVAAGAVVFAGSRGRPDPAPADREDGEDGGLVAETLHAAHAHGVFLLLTSLDVLLARHVLSPHQAGVYAVGAVLTRATLWLPQSVVLLLFASLSEQHRHRAAARRAAVTVLGFGALVVAGTALLGHLAVSVAGGRRYHQLDSTIWLWALLGGLLAVLQLAVLAGLAQRNRRRAAVLWATVAVDLVAVLVVGSDATPTRLVTTLLVVTAVAAVVALWMTLRQPAEPAGHGPAVNVGSSPAPKRDATPDGTG